MLALAGGKGGSGKTTTTLGLAAALDGPVVVVDTDRAMPNLHALAGVDRHSTLADLPCADPPAAGTSTDPPAAGPSTDSGSDGASTDPSTDHGAESAELPDAVAQRYPDEPSVFVVPGPPQSADVDLGAALRRLAAETDAPVLLDCPAGAGPDAATPLRVADGTLLVGTLCAPGLRDTAKTAAMARALGTPVHGAVLTRTRLAPTSVTRLLDCPVAASVPRGTTPVLADDSVRAAYVRLADWIQSEEDIL
jgi:septum site-determining protein MinD